MNLQEELRTTLNRASAENASNTPDAILAEFLLDCLTSFNLATRRRDDWYGIAPEPGWDDECREATR